MQQLHFFEQDVFSCLMYYKLNTTGERFATLAEEDANARFLQDELAKRDVQLVIHNRSRNEFYAFLNKFEEFVTFDGNNTLLLSNAVDCENIQEVFGMGALPLPIVELVCEQIKNFYPVQLNQL